MIDFTIHNEAALDRAAQRARERGIVIPTFRQMIDPTQTPAVIQERLRDVGLWDLNPLNLFRITWHNEPIARGGGFGGVNAIEFPPEITGVEARIIALVGKWFPTGAHKVGGDAIRLVDVERVQPLEPVHAHPVAGRAVHDPRGR